MKNNVIITALNSIITVEYQLDFLNDGVFQTISFSDWNRSDFVSSDYIVSESYLSINMRNNTKWLISFSELNNSSSVMIVSSVGGVVPTDNRHLQTLISELI